MGDAPIERDQQCQRRKHCRSRPDHRHQRADRAALRQEASSAKADGKDRSRDQMRGDGFVGRDRSDARHGAAGQHQHVGIAAYCPFQEDHGDQHRACCNGSGCRFRAPRHQQGRRNQHAERPDGAVGVTRGKDDCGGGEHVGPKRTGRDRLDLAGLGRWPEHEAAHHQQCGQHEAGDHMKRMRRDHRYAAVETGERPQDREHDGGDGQPAPQADSRQTESGSRDDGEIDIQRPVIRLVRGDQHGCHEGRGDAETRKRGAVQ